MALAVVGSLEGALRVTQRHKGRKIKWSPLHEVPMNLEKQKAVRTVAGREGLMHQLLASPADRH